MQTVHLLYFCGGWELRWSLTVPAEESWIVVDPPRQKQGAAQDSAAAAVHTGSHSGPSLGSRGHQDLLRALPPWQWMQEEAWDLATMVQTGSSLRPGVAPRHCHSEAPRWALGPACAGSVMGKMGFPSLWVSCPHPVTNSTAKLIRRAFLLKGTRW